MTLASDAERIFRAGVSAVEPARAVRANLRRQGTIVHVGSHSLRLSPEGTVRIVAIGKAAGAMADAAASVVGRHREAIVVTPRGYPCSRTGLPVVFGEHPIPGVGSFRAGRALLRFVQDARPGDVQLFLVSGGSSPVAEVPAGALTRADISRTTELLLASGAPIGAMNVVRRHLSQIKAGQLATAVPAQVTFATLALSDVVGDVPEDIASGPSVPDPSTFRDAVAVVQRYRLVSRLPPRVTRHLSAGARGHLPETPKPGDRRLRDSPFVLLGSNLRAVHAAARMARTIGYRVEVDERPMIGETRPAAVRFADRLLAGGSRVPRALIAGGETTVTLGPRPGRGGRNLEFALACAQLLTGRNALVLSAGTDGIDGSTDAAGGWVDGTTTARGPTVGADIRRALARHASYDALERLGSLLRTGPTGTNVMDLHVGLVVPAVSRESGVE
ncbi:MAG: glycerate kinase [Thermoplasmata archaeon]